MRKKLHSPSSLLVLLLSYAALFILLVVIKNVKFWNMRKVSSVLIEVVSKSVSRQSAFTNSYNNNINEQNSVLKLLYSPAREKDQQIAELTSKIKRNDTGLALNASLVQGTEEQMAIKKLQSLSKLKNDNLTPFIDLIKKGKNNEAVLNYEKYLSPLYQQFQFVNTELLNNAGSKDREEIKVTEGKISSTSRTNFQLSIAIIIVMILIGISLIKIGKINRKTNLELKESERKYRTLTEQTNEIIEKCDENGNFVYANDSFKKTLEYNDAELSTLSFSDILDEKDITPTPFPAQGEEVISHVQKVFITKNGKKRYLEGNLVAEYKNGIFSGTMGFFNDVTEKKQLEESLIASELKFRTFFDVAPIPMCAFDPETYRFILINKAAMTHYGFTEKEFMNKTIMDLRQDELSKVKSDISKVNNDNSGPNQNIIYKYKRNHFKKAGEKIEVEIYTSPIIIEGKKCILAIVIDVTERNQYENKITKAIIKTQEDERYEIGSELHDNVCQILAAARMNLSRLKPSLPPSEMELYCQSSESIRLATEEIRNLSHRLAPAFFDNTRLEEAFEGLLKSFNIKDSYNIFMYFDNSAKNYPLSHEIQINLYRILQEQLRNIINHAKCTAIEVGVFIQNNKLKMRIADDGIGFELNKAKGGIGLANMKRRSELFSGKMQINSSPGNGCELLITIPV